MKMRCSIESRHWVFVTGYVFFFIAKNIGKGTTKTLSGKYRQKLLNHAKQFATDALKTIYKTIWLKKQCMQLVIWLVIKLQTRTASRLVTETPSQPDKNK